MNENNMDVEILLYKEDMRYRVTMGFHFRIHQTETAILERTNKGR